MVNPDTPLFDMEDMSKPPVVSQPPDMSDNYKGGFDERAISDQTLTEKSTLSTGVAVGRTALQEAQAAHALAEQTRIEDDIARITAMPGRQLATGKHVE